MIDLDIDQKALKKLIKDFPVGDKIIRAAHNAAIRKTGIYLNKIATKNLSKDLEISLNLLKDRIKKYQMPSSGGLKRLKILFCGLNAIPLARLNPVQNADGVSAGPAFAQKAFMARLQKGGRQGVYKRKDKRRLPVIAQYYEIHHTATETLEDIAATSQMQGWHAVYIKEFERNLIWRSNPSR